MSHCGYKNRQSLIAAKEKRKKKKKAGSCTDQEL